MCLLPAVGQLFHTLHLGCRQYDLFLLLYSLALKIPYVYNILGACLADNDCVGNIMLSILILDFLKFSTVFSSFRFSLLIIKLHRSFIFVLLYSNTPEMILIVLELL